MDNVYVVMKGSFILENSRFKKKYQYGQVIGLPYIMFPSSANASIINFLY